MSAENLTPVSAAEAFALAVRHQQGGRLREAEKIYRSILTAAPAHPGANHNLGLIALGVGRLRDACLLIAQAVRSAPTQEQFRTSLARALQAYLAAHPEDGIGARGQLAALGLESTPERASDEHMRALYAERAASWPRTAGYQAPQLVADALTSRISAPIRILDAGCGTGLVGPLIRPIARRLVGVDLSEPMVQIARAGGAYDELIVGDLVQHLRERPAGYDAIASAATLIHFGDLSPVLSAAAEALTAGGCLAFTAFPNERDPAGYGVNALDAADRGVFFHGRDYLARQITDAGLELVAMGDEVHESKHQRPFTGLLVVASKGPPASRSL